mgnify:FL=1
MQGIYLFDRFAGQLAVHRAGQADIDELACHDITFCGKVDLSVDIHGLGVAAADKGLRFLTPALAQHFAHIAEDGFIVFVDDNALHID